jgi:hydrogenase-4 component F
MLFLSAGNILRAYRTKAIASVRGLGRRLPFTAFFWTAGILAAAGFPPFGTFLSEWNILKGVIESPRPWLAVPFLAAAAAVFLWTARVLIEMTRAPGGEAAPDPAPGREPAAFWMPLALFLVLLVLLGTWIPPAWMRLARDAASALGVR